MATKSKDRCDGNITRHPTDKWSLSIVIDEQQASKTSMSSVCECVRCAMRVRIILFLITPFPSATHLSFAVFVILSFLFASLSALLVYAQLT